jgi:hypothetical protein
MSKVANGNPNFVSTINATDEILNFDLCEDKI